MSSSRRCVVLVGDQGVPHDGVMDHGVRLTEALSKHVVTTLLIRDLQGRWRSSEGSPLAWPDVRDAVRVSEAVLLSYTPWNLGLGWKHWRFVSELPKLFWAARRARRVLYLHELNAAAPGLDGALDGWAQRQQFRLISRLFPAVVGATFLLPARLRRRRALLPLPMSSNLPDMREARTSTRKELGIDHTLVVASFVQAYLSPMRGLVTAGLEGCRDAGPQGVTHLILGASAESEPVERIAQYTAGPVSADRLASLLACADIMLAPFPDGATSRRTTLASALQHGVPVVTNAGEHTPPWLLTSGALLLAETHEASFRESAGALATDVDQRRALGQTARRLYEERYRWEAVATELHDHLWP